ncbi:putative uncharacterized protein DDB_G0282133 isoform X2 [Teleopsis dalmanni]|uniref:putative uncharacterized protein DDB_G0282133 isoform X2 n=1 Tax=Teleopsis dalmanni TaxID=139649 RepID=UPI0018CCB8E9|nr:putative uncharacterized protein DDB_G0282133 isoform X2 [Teleopsis dalmanni]
MERNMEKLVDTKDCRMKEILKTNNENVLQRSLTIVSDKRNANTDNPESIDLNKLFDLNANMEKFENEDENCNKYEKFQKLSGTGNNQISAFGINNNEIMCPTNANANYNGHSTNTEDTGLSKVFNFGTNMEQDVNKNNDLIACGNTKLKDENNKTVANQEILDPGDGYTTENITNSLNNFSLPKDNVEEQNKFLANSNYKQKHNFFNTIQKKSSNNFEKKIDNDDVDSFSYIFAIHNNAIATNAISTHYTDSDELFGNTVSSHRKVIDIKDTDSFSVTPCVKKSVKQLPNLDIESTQNNNESYLGIDQVSLNTSAISRASSIDEEINNIFNSNDYEAELLEMIPCNEFSKIETEIVAEHSLVKKIEQANVVERIKTTNTKSIDIDNNKLREVLHKPNTNTKIIIKSNDVETTTKKSVKQLPNLDIQNIENNNIKCLPINQYSVNTNGISQSILIKKENEFVMDLDVEMGSCSDIVNNIPTNTSGANSTIKCLVEKKTDNANTNTVNPQIGKETPAAVTTSTKSRKRRVKAAKKNGTLNDIYDTKLKEALHTPIPPENKGFQLMTKMGYMAGTGLGTCGEGITEPICVELKRNRNGVGHQKNEQSKCSNQNSKSMGSLTALEATNKRKAKVTITTQNVNSNNTSKKRRTHSPITFHSPDRSTPPPPAPSFHFSSNGHLLKLSDVSTKRLKLSNILKYNPNVPLSKKNIQRIKEVFDHEISLLLERLQHESLIFGCSKWNIFPCIIALNNDSMATHTYEFIQMEIFNWITRHQVQRNITPKFYGIMRNNKTINIACENRYAYECLENCLEALTTRPMFENLTLTLQPCFNDLSCYGIHFKGVLRNPDMLLPQLQAHEPKLFTELWLLITHVVNSEKFETYFMVLMDEQSALVIEHLVNKILYVLTHKVTFSFKGKLPKTNNNKC